MSRIRVTIDRLVLRGFDPGDGRALTEELKNELSRALANRAEHAAWARARRTPIVRLGRMPLEPGPSGGRKFGGGLARAITRGLKP